MLRNMPVCLVASLARRHLFVFLKRELPSLSSKKTDLGKKELLGLNKIARDDGKYMQKLTLKNNPKIETPPKMSDFFGRT